MLEEVLKYLNPQPNQNFVDCTFGGGGHSLAILDRIKPNGKLIGIDWDPVAVQNSQNKNLILVNDNYKNLRKIINDTGIHKISGILLDLGFSSDQLFAEGRGFSFQDKGSLDLRYNPESQSLTAADMLGSYSYSQLFEIFKEYGEEPLSRQIAQKIIADRQKGIAIETAEMLVQLVSQIYSKKFRTKSRKNPATRVFQALRIAVNDEFGNIVSVLPEAIDCLEISGRLAAITFHSGEDRIVKKWFKDFSQKEFSRIKLITKKPIIPSVEEVARNPRSRSAKLRVVERIR